MLPEWGLEKYEFYHGQNAAASSYNNIFSQIASSQTNVTSLTDCSNSASVSSFEDCLLLKTPIKKKNNNLFNFYGETYDTTNGAFSYALFQNSTYPLVGFIAKT